MRLTCDFSRAIHEQGLAVQVMLWLNHAGWNKAEFLNYLCAVDNCTYAWQRNPEYIGLGEYLDKHLKECLEAEGLIYLENSGISV